MAKILVSMDPGLIARIDKAADAAGLSRSAYLARLAARELDAAGGPGRSPTARRALGDLDALFASAEGVPAALVREERDLH